MTCGTCIRWRRLQRPRLAPPSWRTRYGVCRWPGTKPEPYWREAHPTGDLLVADVHGTECAAFRARRPEPAIGQLHDRIAARFPNVLNALAESERADLHSSVNTGKED